MVVCALFLGLVALASYASARWQVTGSAALIGLCVGSFANVVIWRLPIMLERRWALEAMPGGNACVPDLPDSTAVSARSYTVEQAGVVDSAGVVEHTSAFDPAGVVEHASAFDPASAADPASIVDPASSVDPAGSVDPASVVGHAKRSPPAFDLAYPPSACPRCHTQIASWQNVPVLSYLWLRGRCASCKVAISARYPTIELLFGLTYGGIAWHFGLSVELFAYAVFFSLLAMLFAIDADTQLLPDGLTLPLLWGGLLANVVGLHTSLDSAVLGAAGGYGVLWLIAAGFLWATGKEGMGGGDPKLLAALGAWLGWQALPWIMLIAASLSVGFITLRVTAQRSTWAQAHAFGPHLILAAGAVTLFDLAGKPLDSFFQL